MNAERETAKADKKTRKLRPGKASKSVAKKAKEAAAEVALACARALAHTPHSRGGAQTDQARAPDLCTPPHVRMYHDLCMHTRAHTHATCVGWACCVRCPQLREATSKAREAVELAQSGKPKLAERIAAQGAQKLGDALRDAAAGVRKDEKKQHSCCNTAGNREKMTELLRTEAHAAKVAVLTARLAREAAARERKVPLVAAGARVSNKRLRRELLKAAKDVDQARRAEKKVRRAVRGAKGGKLKKRKARGAAVAGDRALAQAAKAIGLAADAEEKGAAATEAGAATAKQQRSTDVRARRGMERARGKM